MRVLVISLLRLGDFIQILPVLQALKEQHSILELDVLTHSPVKQLAPMVDSVHRWFTLDRDELQAGLGRADLPLLTSFSVLKEQLDTIDRRGYDCIINLTQTVYSGWIAGYLSTSQRYGLAIDAKGQAQFHSAWFQYLDEHAPLSVDDVFHYTDIFHYGCGLKNTERKWILRETRHGRAEAEALQIQGEEKIVLQTLTSDSKKTWPEESWVQMLSQLRLFRPKAQFIALGAPSEEIRIDGLLELAMQKGVTIKKAIVSLEGAFSLLRSASLLITGDTSIKHLANATGVPILELSLGSSDYRRTGAYRAGSLILQPAVACSPCPHSAPCSRATHECAAGIAPDAVSAAAHHHLSGDWLSLRELAREYDRELKFLRTRNLSNGFWLASDVIESHPERAIEKIIERCTWKFLLNREHLEPIAKFGSEGINMRRELESLFPGTVLSCYSQHLGFLETQVESFAEKAASLLSTVSRRAPAVDDIKEFFKLHQPHSTALTWLESAPSSAEDPTAIGGLRRMHNQLESCYQRAQVKKKMIRSLKSQLMELK